MKFSSLPSVFVCAVAPFVLAPLALAQGTTDIAPGKVSGCLETITVTPTYGVPPSRRGVVQHLKPLKGPDLKRNIIGKTYSFEQKDRSKLWQTFNAGGSCELLVGEKGGKKRLNRDCTWEFQGCTVTMRYKGGADAETKTRATLYPFERVMKFRVTTNGTGAVVRDGNYIPERYYAKLKADVAKQD